MQIEIANVPTQTYLFIGFFILALASTMSRRANPGTFGVDVTRELKGFAIFAIVISHVGYFLVADHGFLFPLSVLAGVGVDIFLILSGFGLTTSALLRDMSPREFYKKRLSKLYIPLWLVLSILFICDFLFLRHSYGFAYIMRSFLGFFPNADIYADVNSPLWYFSWIVFFYALFPLVFSRKRPVVSACVLAGAAWLVSNYPPEWLRNVSGLYQLHAFAFPLGMFWAIYLQRSDAIVRPLKDSLYYPVMLFLAGSVAYLAMHAPIGEWYLKAEMESILTALLVIALFVLKRQQMQLLSVLGIFSFEIYLMHWPLMYRYDVLFKFLPGAIAMALYIALFVGLGWCFQKLVSRVGGA